MAGLTKYPEPLVFGLDIGTRSIVGTVGYQDGKQFNIVAQCVKFHDTRAMLDGQIHDINKVGEEIIYVKEELEKQLPGRKLKEVCIAAAGRVLKTSVGKGYYEFQENTVVNQEYIHSLEMLGVEQAHELMLEENDTDVKFFCVGYTVVKYYLNGFEIGNLEGHKAHNIGADVLATFLPEEVVDGLYAAVSMADLEIANMTLEPIAAIRVAIPESFRLLNIALVDVGAGTSDICITKDGTIIGYGMLPNAGDEITECLVQSYLVDFDTAEKIKTASPTKKMITYKDIMGISQKVTPQEVLDKVNPVVEEMTRKTAERIKELNGGKSVSAVFVVGGGGKIKGYTEMLAKHLELPAERVALRGEEVLGFVNIFVEGVKKDPLLVTPIGICLNFFDQKNHFIFLQVNNERVKLYNNDKLTVFDAALAYGLTNEDVFPKRGEDLNYTLNGKPKFIRGGVGEPASIQLNGKDVGMNHSVEAGDKLEIKPSTAGTAAKAVLGEVADLSSMITFEVNDRMLSCPRYASVNDKLQSEFYEIQEGDKVEILNYYTLSQLMQFMDIVTPHEVFVNGARAGADTKIYENFKVAWIDREDIYKAQRFVTEEPVPEKEEEQENVPETDKVTKSDVPGSVEEKEVPAKTETIENTQTEENVITDIHVTVNGKAVTLTGKKEYVFVDVFDKYDFDLKNIGGTRLVQTIDGVEADHFSPLHQGAVVEIYWTD
ncbi:MAG: cell division FtsA domain-containing protein [Clostridiales bacterium]|nr:cell division FtsA domain-containing protein [Clostridiales bacterium]